jgi:hypothetical protein
VIVKEDCVWVNSKRGNIRAKKRLWLLLGGKCKSEMVIKRGRRSGIGLNTEMQVTGFSCNDGPEWEGWRIRLERIGGQECEAAIAVHSTRRYR